MPRVLNLCLSLAILTCLLPFSTLGQTNKKYQGLLWEISGNGLENPSYLYGTMHVSRKVAFHLSDSVFNALYKADVIALESDPGLWMDESNSVQANKDMEIWKSGVKATADNIYNNFTKDPFTKEHLLQILVQNNYMINGLLYRSVSTFQEFEENTYLDLFFYQAGKKLGKEVIALENTEETEALIQKAYEPDKKKKKTYTPSYTLNFSDRLDDAYRSGDLDMIDSISTLTAISDRYLEYFLYKRNEIHAEGMDSLMQTGQVVFGGVGAAHLPGKNGVIEMLREMGYELRPVRHQVSGVSTDEWNKIEELEYPRTFTKVWSEDSAYSFAAPHHFYYFNMGDYTENMYPDMANGSFYTIRRLPTHSPLFDRDEEYVIKVIDSMLYEYIPGKILTRESIETNGIKGYDITNRTRKGDLQHYRIYVTPLEILLFKLNGTGDYILNSKVEEEFYNSIDLKGYTKEKWSKYVSPGGEYTLETPLPLNGYQNTLHNQSEVQMFIRETGDYYAFGRMGYSDDYLEEDTFELAEVIRNLSKELDAELISAKHKVEKGYPVYEAKYKTESGKYLFVKTRLKGPAYYYQLVLKEDKAYPKRFFESFEFTAPKYEMKFREFTDTLIQFTSVILDEPYHYKPYYKNFMSYGYGYGFYGDTDFEKYQTTSKSSNYFSGNTYEKISVYTYIYGRYAQSESLDSLVKDIEEDIKLRIGDDVEFSDKQFSEIDGDKIWDYVITRENCSRSLRYKVVFSGDRLYKLLATFDNKTGPTPFIDSFYSNFKPIRHTEGWDLFETKSKYFFEDLGGEDSILNEFALNYGYLIDFEAEDVPRLQDIYDTLDDKIESEAELKSSLRWEISTKDHPLSHAFVEKEFHEHEDDANTQLALLFYLSTKEDSNSVAQIKKLLIEYTPLINSTYNNYIVQMFSSLEDSLELAVDLYPELLQLTRYPEYKSRIYKLLANIFDEALMNEDMLGVEVNSLMRDGKDAIKRKLASEGGTNYTYTSYATKELVTSYEESTTELISLARVIAQLDTSDRVNYFFDKFYTSTDVEELMNCLMIRLDNELPVHDSLWKKLEEDTAIYANLYFNLLERNALHLIKDHSGNEEFFISSLLYQGEYKEDSIHFIKKVYIDDKEHPGNIYFFKRKSEEDIEWHMDFIGPIPEKLAELDLDILDYKVSSSYQTKYLDDKSLMKDVDAVVDYFRLKNRPRALSNRYNYTNYGGMF